jgi:hypothetical protein
MHRGQWRALLTSACLGWAALAASDHAWARSASETAVEPSAAKTEPPVPGRRGSKPAAGSSAGQSSTQVQAQAERLARITGVKSWGYQLNGLSIEEAARSPYDLLVVDATTGLARANRSRRRRSSGSSAPDGGRRIVVSYLSVGGRRTTGRTISRPST